MTDEIIVIAILAIFYLIYISAITVSFVYLPTWLAIVANIIVIVFLTVKPITMSVSIEAKYDNHQFE